MKAFDQVGKKSQGDKYLDSLRIYVRNLELELAEFKNDKETMHVIMDVIQKHDALLQEWEAFLIKVKLYEPTIEILITDFFPEGESEDGSENPKDI
jgi:hypothetical protein